MAHRKGLYPSPFFVMRTPLLAADVFTKWAEGLGPDRTSPEALETLRQRLRATLDDPVVREAILVASPSLATRLDAWRTCPSSKAGAKAEPALVRYVARMCARPSPFGLFAAVAMGTVGDDATSFALHGDVRRCARIDMAELTQMAWQLEAEPRVRARLRYRPARVRYRVGDRLFAAVEERRVDHHAFRLVAFAVDPPLEVVLRRAEAGARIGELVDALCAFAPDATVEDARAYVEQLVDDGLLLGGLVPPLTVGDPASAVARALAEHGLDEDAARVRDLVEAAKSLSSKPLGADADDYQAVFASARDEAERPPAVRRIQVDAVRSGGAGALGPEVVRELAKAMDLLPRLLGPSRDPLAKFRAAFAKRFEQRRVPLAHALDADVGVRLEAANTDPSADVWSARSTWLLEKLESALLRGAREIEVDPRELERFAPPSEPLPASMAALFTVIASSSEAVRRGDFRVLFQGAEGPSGARMIARFGAWDAALEHALSEHLRGEERRRPDAIFAEIAQAPTAPRDANIVVRPQLREHEIVLCATPGAREEACIGVDDLEIALRGERLVLWSRRLGREVVPRISSAHNYFGGQIELYRLLCELQDQKQLAYVYWNWRALLHAPYLPRVTCGKLVLARAAWRLGRGELARLGARTTAARFAAMQEIRRARDLPRFVGHREGGTMLPVDLDNPLSVDSFASEAKRATSAELVELFVDADALPVAGAAGARWVHEIVLPFFTTPEPDPAAPRPASPRTPASAVTVRRHFPPGTEWLYLKAEASDATIERVLRDDVSRIVDALTRDGVVDRFFFVRYADPEPELRLRLRGEGGPLLTHALAVARAALEPWIVAGLVRNFSVATYEREVERYGGGAGIALAEDIFDADSRCVLEVLSMIASEREADRWKWGLLGMHRMLQDLRFDDARRNELVRVARRSFAAELSLTKDDHRRLDALYRAERPFLEAVLCDSAGAALHRDIDAAFARRSAACAPAIRSLLSHARSGALGAPLSAIAASLLHMFANRLFVRAGRAQELVAYAMLDRLYASASARRRAR